MVCSNHVGNSYCTSSKWWRIKLIPLCDRAEEYGPLFRIFVLHKCMVVPTSRGSMKVNVTYMSHSEVGKCYKKNLHKPQPIVVFYFRFIGI